MRDIKSKKLPILIFGLIVSIIVVLFNLIIAKDVSLFAHIGLSAFGLVVSLATLFSSKTTRTDYLSIAHWKKLKSISIGIGAFVAGLSAIALVLPFVSPSVDEMLQRILKSVIRTEEVVVQNTKQLDEISKAVGVDMESETLKEVNGIWGERGCSVTYEIQIKEKSLTMRSLKSVKGMAPYQSIGTIIDTKTIIGGNSIGVVINTTSESGADRGKSIGFSYENNGAIKRLVRRDYSREIPLVLDYCGE